MHKKQSFDRESISVNLSALTNPKYEIARQKTKELFLIWLDNELNFKHLEKLLDSGQLIAEAPNPLQEETPAVHSTLNKSFVAPPVMKKKDTGGFLSKTIMPTQKRSHGEPKDLQPKLSLLRTTREPKTTSNNIVNLNFVLLANSFGENYNAKEEKIESLFQKSPKLNKELLCQFVMEVLELPEAFHVCIGNMGGLIRKHDSF